MADDVVASIIEDLKDVSDRPLTPDDVQALKDAVRRARGSPHQ